MSAGRVQPEGSFIYGIVVRCTSLDRECTGVTVTDTLPSAFVPGASLTLALGAVGCGLAINRLASRR